MSKGRAVIGIGGIIITATSILAVKTNHGSTDQYIKHMEGEELVSYRDAVGVWTICSGTTKGVKQGDRATKELCAMMRKEDLIEAAEHVLRIVPPETLTNERAFALTSFVHNLGAGTLASSTMLKLFKQGRIAEACKQLTEACGKYGCNGFVYAGGKKLGGLVNRRKNELELCEIGVST